MFDNGDVSAPLATVFDTQADRILRPIDIDLSAMRGARTLRLRVEAGPSASQDWAVWIDPRVEG